MMLNLKRYKIITDFYKKKKIQKIIFISQTKKAPEGKKIK